VTVKIAMSLDGRTALANGASQWITGPEARADVQRLRASSDAVVTGIGTILSDDPRLTVRDATLDTLGRQPLRVIVDSHLRTPLDAQVLKQPGETVIVHLRGAGGSALRAAGAQLLEADRGSAGVDVETVLQELARRECNEVLIEAGPTLAGHVMAAGLADELIVYLAPVLLGDTAQPMARFPALSALSDALSYRWAETRRVGADLRLRLVPTTVD
jgi:diaminohydroxyphosphoribosylaminopyrimidine deaminase / 5-amino-6-(5-phosphoribosylamino)uracil reductase